MNNYSHCVKCHVEIKLQKYHFLTTHREKTEEKDQVLISGLSVGRVTLMLRKIKESANSEGKNTLIQS